MPRSRPGSGLAVLVLLLPVIASCAVANASPAAQDKPTGQREIAVPVNTKTVQKGTIAAILSYSGDIQSQARVDILPRATGRIDKLYVDVGDTVKAGDVVAELDRTQLDAQVAQAQGALASAQARLDLLRAGARPEDVEAGRAALDSAQAQLDRMLQGGRPEDVASA